MQSKNEIKNYILYNYIDFTIAFPPSSFSYCLDEYLSPFSLACHKDSRVSCTQSEQKT